MKITVFSAPKTLSERFTLIERGFDPSVTRVVSFPSKIEQPRHRKANMYSLRKEKPLRPLSYVEKMDMCLDDIIEYERKRGTLPPTGKRFNGKSIHITPFYRPGMTREEREHAKLDAELEEYFLASPDRARAYLDRELEEYFKRGPKRSDWALPNEK
jgi:hypothetical protein